MSLLSINGAAILAPEDGDHKHQNLVVQPLSRLSVAMQVSTIVTTGHQTHFPIVVTDPTYAWTAEGQEINVTDPTLDELVCTPAGLKGLTVVSNELMADSNPSALEVVGQGLVRDPQVKLDAAYFGDTTLNGPSGLESLASVQETTLSFSIEQNLDPFAKPSAAPRTSACQPSQRTATPAWPSSATQPTCCWSRPPRQRPTPTSRCSDPTPPRPPPAACSASRCTQVQRLTWAACGWCRETSAS